MYNFSVHYRRSVNPWGRGNVAPVASDEVTVYHDHRTRVYGVAQSSEVEFRAWLGVVYETDETEYVADGEWPKLSMVEA